MSERSINVAIKQEFDSHAKQLSPWNQFVLSKSLDLRFELRHYFGNRYLFGEGLEIGALWCPLQITNGQAHVKHVDRVSKEESAQHYGLDFDALVEPDYLLEADNLHTIPSNSVDFLIANHVLEHTDDPIGTMVEWLRVLKEEGVLYITIPNYRANEYDYRRKPATLDHLISDYDDASNQKQPDKIGHWKEFIISVLGLEEQSVKFEQKLAEYIKADERTHFHVYNASLMGQILQFIHNDLKQRVRILDSFHLGYSYEILLVLQRDSARLKSPQFTAPFTSVRSAAMLLFMPSYLYVKEWRKRAWLKDWDYYLRTFTRELKEQGPLWVLRRSYQWLKWIYRVKP